jgi:predicted ester cyclase
VIKTDLSDLYRGYIACLNRQNWAKLKQFVHDDVHYNGQWIGLPGYREMLERDFQEIPDLCFNIQLLMSDPPYIASRLGFDCTPKGKFHEFREEKIVQVWSVIDKAAIEAQI